MFRHFNRVVSAFATPGRKPDWDALDEELSSAGKGLHKPFSRPVTVYDLDGEVIGEDTVTNAVYTFKNIWAHPAFARLCSLIEAGVTEPSQFQSVRAEWRKLSSDHPGALGTYRVKNNLDLLVYAGLLARRAIASYPISPKSGTWLSLEYLYGTKVSSEPLAEKMLIHLWHQLRLKGHFKTQNDSLATLGLCLCGFHRSHETVDYQGRKMSCLDRAIREEEKQYLELHQALRESST